ncbi:MULTISPECIES: hypothetical protein [Rhizobium]|uniref:hypothetical protein n=1 Tax=Rhizobium TaxID=379 RepID=UPI00019053AC|nr:MULTISPECIES: hypothetical protein [Rhizobium]ARQ59421.1 hypothetical protein Kim5_CH03397 [Rhizobium sp. Kim5]
MITALYSDQLIGGFVEAADRVRIVDMLLCLKDAEKAVHYLRLILGLLMQQVLKP